MSRRYKKSAAQRLGWLRAMESAYNRKFMSTRGTWTYRRISGLYGWKATQLAERMAQARKGWITRRRNMGIMRKFVESCDAVEDLHEPS